MWVRLNRSVRFNLSMREYHGESGGVHLHPCCSFCLLSSFYFSLVIVPSLTILDMRIRSTIVTNSVHFYSYIHDVLVSSVVVVLGAKQSLYCR